MHSSCPRLAALAPPVNFRARIRFFKAVWIAIFFIGGMAKFASAQNVAYPKIEASFNVTNSMPDPFDFMNADLRVQVRQPDGSIANLLAFFDGGTTWRVRHTPMTAGVYTIISVTLNGQPISVNNLQPPSWTVAGAPTSPGFVGVDARDSVHFLTSNGRRFFPTGHDNAWDVTGAANVIGIMAKMGGTHENWSRVWMNYWDGKNLDWPSVGAFGQLSLTVAQKWDAIVAAADGAGVHFQMTLHHHGEYSTMVDPNWPDNPYNTANGGFLSDPTQFFTNSMAIALTERKLRYSVARWGYSPAIMGWELFNEVENTDAARNNEWGIIESWHNLMAAFLRSQDIYRHLITTSSVLNEPIWDATDYYQHHDYPTDLIGSIQASQGISAGDAIAPIFGGECGIDFTPHVGVSPPLWAGLMSAQSGNDQPWYWDVIDTNNDYTLLRAVSDFAAMSGIGDQNGLVKSAPPVTCSQASSLVFAPGGGYANAPQSVFTVGNTAPAGIGSLPSFLQGTYHRSMTPNGYTFLVNYPQAGTFSVQVTQIAQSGDALTILVDNSVLTNVSFAASPAGYTTNATFTVNVPAGSHSILLTNGGLDWIVLGNLTLNPYVPIIGAYQVSNPNFAALWFWHRTNVFSANATSTVAAQASLSGLAAGTYSATWWDTFAGTSLSNFTFTVSNTNIPITLATPPILRSLALYVGPQAGGVITPPILTQTVGTNAPAFSVPLMIANSGGLPLSYSLSVIGASPIAYAALSSAQIGGPAYAWKDISGVGVEITSNFTALAPPKAAGDEGIAGPINIGFSFPFFNGAQSPGSFTQLYISPNGFISFSPFTGDTSTNRAFPSALNPANSIAFYWRDLALGSIGHIYTYYDALADTFTVQFQNVPIKNSSSRFTGQIVLKTTGEILAQYQAIGTPNIATLGLQNAAQNQGLSVGSGANYLQTNFAVLLSPASWLSFDSTAGLVSKSSMVLDNIFFNAGALAPGNYQATLLVNTSDPNTPTTSLPVNFTISPNLPAAPSALMVDSLTWSHVVLSWVNNSANSTGYEIERATGSNGVYGVIGTVSGSITNFTDATATSQTTYFYRLIATNNFGTSPPSLDVGAITPLAPVDEWRLANFGTTINSGIAADTADPDHDGLINLVEYAFASNPNVPSANSLSDSVVNNQLTLIFKRPDPVPLDINYIIEVATDLTSGNWSSVAGTATQTVVNNNDGTETVTVTDASIIGSSAAHYLRVRIQRQ